MGGIFISYRRHDSAGWTGRLSERMENCFGQEQIFMDIEKIEAGTDFIEAIESAIGSCGVLLAIIGPGWLTSADAEGHRRLDKPDDFIRLEVASALGRGIKVIPVLVGGAAMPAPSDLPDDLKPLTRRQAHELSDNRWDYDTEQLENIIEKSGVKRKHQIKPDPHLPETPLKISRKAISSLAVSALTGASLASENNVDMDTKIGLLAMGLAALGLGVFAFFDIKLHKAKGRTLSIIAMSIAGLILLLSIGLISTPAPDQQKSSPPQPETNQQPPATIPTVPPPVANNLQPSQTTITGVWGGSDGMIYTIQQQGNLIAIVGGYPNQPLTVSATGTLNDSNLELDFIRTTDNTGGKARLNLSANGLILKGIYQNMVTGEKGELLLNRSQR